MLPHPLLRDQLIFPGRDGGPLDLAAWRRGPWTKALTAAKLMYREPYGMRDTFATLSLNDGAPLEWIAGQMGHDEIDTTRKHYARAGSRPPTTASSTPSTPPDPHEPDSNRTR